MIQSIKIKIGKATIEVTPEELEELKRDILELSPEPPTVIPAPYPVPRDPWPPYSPTPFYYGSRAGDALPPPPVTIC